MLQTLMELVSFAVENDAVGRKASWLTHRTWNPVGHIGTRALQSFYYYDAVRREAEARCALTLCEVGLNGGHSAAVLLEAGGRSSRLQMFELGLPYTPVAQRVIERLFPGQMNLVLGDSAVTMPRMYAERGAHCDVMSIDGDHREPNFRRDLPHALRLCRKGALLLFDDMSSKGLIRHVVEEFAHDGRLDELQCTPDHDMRTPILHRFDFEGNVSVSRNMAWCSARSVGSWWVNDDK